MKCELCHNHNAETVLQRGGEDELYVCRACADAARVKRQAKRTRTRGEMTEVPPMVGAIMNAFDELFEKIGKSVDVVKVEKTVADKAVDFPLSRVPPEFRLVGRLHLEGLFLIGEIEAVKRSMRALNMELTGVSFDGINDVGHVYAFGYRGSSESAKRVVSDLLREERNARVRLFEEMPRVFGDSLCRALAILKNCRLLSSAELFDILSPIRLAAREKMLDGITLASVDRLLSSIDLSGSSAQLDQAEKDAQDSERADEMNRLFEGVVLNERGEGKFL